MPKNFNVLVVDDEPEILDVYRFIFEKLNLNVIAAGDGAQALAILAHNKFDLVVSDLMMPNVTGLKLIREMKKSKIHADCPVVIVSGYLSAELTKEFGKLGQFHLLQKPFLKKDISRIVEFALRSKKSEFEKSPISIQDQPEFQNLASRVEHVICSSMKTVFYIMIQKSIVSTTVRTKTKKEISGDIGAILGFTIDQDYASLGIVFDRIAFVEACRIWLGTEGGIDNAPSDAVCEMLNIIYGDIKTALNQMGFRMSMSIPKLVEENGLVFDHGKSSSVVSISFKVDGIPALAAVDFCRIEFALDAL